MREWREERDREWFRESESLGVWSEAITQHHIQAFASTQHAENVQKMRPSDPKVPLPRIKNTTTSRLMFLKSQCRRHIGSFRSIALNAAVPASSHQFTTPRHYSTDKTTNAASNLTDAAPTLPTDLSLFEKLDSTLLDAFTSITPSTHFQTLLTTLHENMHLPWWAAIMLTGATMRLMFLPLSIKSLRNAQKLKNSQPELQKLAIQAKHLIIQNEIEKEQGKGATDPNIKRDLERTFGLAEGASNDINQSTNMRILLAHKRRELYKKEGISFLATFSTLLQVPFFAGLFFALRGMRDQLHHGGALWFTDLAQPDYALAAILTSIIMVGHEVNTRSKWSQNYSMPEELRVRSRNTTRLMVLMVGMVAAQLESAILMYWIPSTLIQITANLLLTNENVRRKLRIPDSKPWSLEELQKYDEELSAARETHNLQRRAEERTRQLHEERASRIQEMSHQLQMQFQEIAQETPEIKQRLQEMAAREQVDQKDTDASGLTLDPNMPLTQEDYKKMLSLLRKSDQREAVQEILQQIDAAQREMDLRAHMSEVEEFEQATRNIPGGSGHNVAQETRNAMKKNDQI